VRVSGSSSVIVNAAVDECFAGLVAFERYPEWYPGVQEAELVSGADEPPAVRLVFSSGLPMLPRVDCVLAFEVHAPTSVKPTAVSGAMALSGSGWALEPDGPGRTHVSYDITVEMDVPGGMLAERFIKDKAKHYLIDEPVASLKRLAESRSQAPPDP
jgi:carbon monoxide dehydrogenase subunit G